MPYDINNLDKFDEFINDIFQELMGDVKKFKETVIQDRQEHYNAGRLAVLDCIVKLLSYKHPDKVREMIACEIVNINKLKQ